VGDVPAAVDRRADDGRYAKQGTFRQHLPSHSSVGVQHGPPVDGRGVHAQVLNCKPCRMCEFGSKNLTTWEKDTIADCFSSVLKFYMQINQKLMFS
jgi:hypothetical protein